LPRYPKVSSIFRVECLPLRLDRPNLVPPPERDLYRRTGKRELAQGHLTTATTMYRAMGMTYWLEQAEAEELSELA